MTKESY